jgi:hypothetical protein
VVSVGGFLGMDSKYVGVPYSLFVVHDKQMLLPGATKESLKSLPQLQLVTDRGKPGLPVLPTACLQRSAASAA